MKQIWHLPVSNAEQDTGAMQVRDAVLLQCLVLKLLPQQNLQFILTHISKSHKAKAKAQV